MSAHRRPRPVARPPAPAPTAAIVLTKAVVRAAAFLGLTQKDLAGVLGLSEATVSRMHAGRYALDPARAKEWELARLFVRLFRSLDALWGHGEEARAWLGTANLALAAAPRELLTSIEGLVRVVDYLDAARGQV